LYYNSSEEREQMIKEICKNDLKKAIALVNEVFSEFVAVDYSQQGIDTFESYLENKYEDISTGIESGDTKMWGYYLNGEIIGVVAIRDVTHISLLFVGKEYHRRGIAGELLNTVLEYLENNEGITEITVNSSPYAVVVYEHLGFHKTGEQQEKDGIIFIPMLRSLTGGSG